LMVFGFSFFVFLVFCFAAFENTYEQNIPAPQHLLSY
jgi:hypothetical protein